MLSTFRPRTTSVGPADTQRSIPGKFGSSTLSIGRFTKQGNELLKERQERYKSSVFRVYIGVKAIALLDNLAIHALFDYDSIAKEPGFGKVRLNFDLMANIRPSIFSNDQPHINRKLFIMSVIRHIPTDYLIKITDEIIRKRFEEWSNKYIGSMQRAALSDDFERNIQRLCSDIINFLFLGVFGSFDAVIDWSNGLLEKSRRFRFMKTQKYVRAYDGYRELIKIIDKSVYNPKIKEIAANHSLDYEDAQHNLLFAIVFNAFGGCNCVMRTCAARIALLTSDQKNRLIVDIKHQLHRNEGLCSQSLHQMHLLESFVLEVLRTSPPISMIFGRARRDMLIRSSSGKFDIVKGQLLVGSIYLAQRDPKIFGNPDDFKPYRFAENPELKQYLVYEAGPFTSTASVECHQCPGKGIVMPLLKLFCMYLLLHTEYSFYTQPTWNCNKIQRTGCPDEVMQVKRFTYQPDKVAVHLPQYVMDSINLLCPEETADTASY